MINMINEKDIVFVTTTLYTKWLNYQKRIVKDLFPDSQHIIVDGRGNWPNSWFYWIDEVKKCDQKYFVHLDEDFFITSKDEFMKVFDKMESEGLDLVGCSDGYHHFRQANPVAINTFLMYGKVEHIKKIEFNPELCDVTLDCINYIDNLNGKSLYNYGYRNEPEFKYDEWVSKDEIINYLKSVNDFKFEFGDVYCKKISKN